MTTPPPPREITGNSSRDTSRDDSIRRSNSDDLRLEPPHGPSARPVSSGVGPDGKDAEADAEASRSDSTGRVGRVILLGTGTSVGIPALGCTCPVCQSVDPHNQRLRCAMVAQWDDQTLLIDTPPDLRTQLLRERIGLVNAVLFTHEHADHVFGLDDLRLFPFRLGKPVPLYCQDQVEQRIRRSFDYAFQVGDATHPGARPQLEIVPIDHDPFEVLGIRVMPIPMIHGPRFEVLGFRIGDFAYCTDTSEIPEASMRKLAGIRTLVLGALRHTPHPTHLSLSEAIEVAERLQPEMTYLTHISHDLEYEATNAMLPPGIRLSYDGLRIEIALDA